MDLLTHLPLAVWLFWAFAFGCAVGSFLNVFVARLPFEKSVVWPGSRCFTCLQPLRLSDNIPIVGYLRLRGRCRWCGATFSSRYLWVELGTGLAFAALFYLEFVQNWFNVPAIAAANWELRSGVPPVWVWAVFFYHATLVSLLIAASLIDYGHRIIPLAVTYPGAVLGLVGAALMPWPWPGSPSMLTRLPPGRPWTLPEMWDRLPLGVQPWPFWEPFGFAPPGSWQMGLLTGLIGAAAGMLVVRALKWLFEFGFRQEALGAGDADLLMMSGAFVGWQPVVLSVFVGAVVTLAIVLPVKLMAAVRRKPVAEPAAGTNEPAGGAAAGEMPFGPGLAIGVVLCWWGWPWIGPRVQWVFFDELLMGMIAVVMGGGMLLAGLLLRRGPADEG